MKIPTEPIGSIPRPASLIEAVTRVNGDETSLTAAYDAAIRDTVKQFEATGSPVITDGEQWKYHNFWTYSVQGLANTDADGFKIPFAAGHTRRMPRLTGGPFRYRRYADVYLEERPALRRRAGQASRHLAFGVEPDVSRNPHSGLLARRVHRRSHR